MTIYLRNIIHHNVFLERTYSWGQMELLQAFLSVSIDLEAMTSMRRRRRVLLTRPIQNYGKLCEKRGNLGTAGCVSILKEIS